MILEEKTIIIGALFHDIGKFEQRCTNEKTKHEQLGYRFLTLFEEKFIKILGDTESFNLVRTIVSEHHNRNTENEFVNIIREADHLSASERVELDEADSDLRERWSHKFLSSLFSKIYLNNPKGKKTRYYEQKLLTERDYRILIPEFDNEDSIKESGHKYNFNDFQNFKEELTSILDFYQSEEDFYTLISLILILFEKYMWCIPDFTGSEHTDISLYNHLKDVAGIAHAIYKSKDKEGSNLNLIIGDVPGIQKYIFNVAYKKPAKVLRGRSIFVQILTRQFATIMLKELGLTDVNLIMLAGGKFYILAQSSEEFETNFENANEEIEKRLIENFNYQLSFSSVFETFDFKKLMEKDKEKRKTFGDVIDKASYNLLLKRNQQFKNHLFDFNNFKENKFVLKTDYVKPKENGDTNKIKDTVTGLPIREGYEKLLPNSTENELVDKQVFNEIKVGTEAPQSNVVILFDKDYSTVKRVIPIDKYEPDKNDIRILLNPDLDKLIEKGNLKKDILRNTQIIEVANYSTWDDKNDHVMEFEDVEKTNIGAKFLTLIKGDVDNLGLIMSSGLVDDKEDYTAISRTTTLSNHLKYFFSFSLNGFLSEWNEGKIESEFVENINDQKVYTVFAGGDDLMLISPQSSSLKLLEALNKTFNDFVCDNPEVHISYSLTNFKHNTPIRIVADIAEENQRDVKKTKAEKIIEKLDSENDIFHTEKDKAATRLFDTDVKNKLIKDILNYKKDLISWEKDDNNKVSQGVLRNLLYFSQIMRDYNVKNDTSFLMWHPKLNYMINRLLKINANEYYNIEVKSFFENALKINKKNNIEAQLLEKILYPAVCEAIYGTRNSKGE